MPANQNAIYLYISKAAEFAQLIKEAMAWNEQGIKLPSKPATTEKMQLFVPDYFTQALQKNKNASQTFEKYPYNHKKEYIEWITQAKTEATPNKRTATAIEWLAEEGKVGTGSMRWRLRVDGWWLMVEGWG